MAACQAHGSSRAPKRVAFRPKAGSTAFDRIHCAGATMSKFVTCNIRNTGRRAIRHARSERLKHHPCLVIGSLVLLSSAPAFADKQPCPARELGSYPWGSIERMSGDYWAWVYLDVDDKGYPQRCYLGQNNVIGEGTRSNICRSFLSSWRAIPPENRSPSGVTRISRYFVLLGRKHQAQLDRAKRQYFTRASRSAPRVFRGGGG